MNLLLENRILLPKMRVIIWGEPNCKLFLMFCHVFGVRLQGLPHRLWILLFEKLNFRIKKSIFMKLKSLEQKNEAISVLY
jgi:hypothetical protein